MSDQDELLKEIDRLNATNAELTEALDSLVDTDDLNTLALRDRRKEIERLRALNAELVVALRRAESFLISYHGPDTMWILDEIRAALAKAKGET